MGYELNKLMKQYGVSTPGMVPYTGSMTDTEALQRYNQYRTDYMNRIASTPMYGEEQYLTGLAGERKAPVYETPIGTPSMPADTVRGGDDDDTTTGGGGDDTTTGGGKDDVSAAPGAYEYDYFENTPAENAKLRELAAGPNAKARAALIELYMTTFNRLPDKPGFEHYLNTIGADDYISPDEEAMFLRNAKPELDRYNELQGLYGKYAGREADIPGLEYWMGEIGRMGGLDPVRNRFLAGIKQEIDMGNAGFRPGMYDVNQMGSNITQEQSNQLYAAAPFVFGQDSTGAANNRARQQLYDLYTKNLGRAAPDVEGFNWWIKKIGDDNIITPEEERQFLDEAARQDANKAAAATTTGANAGVGAVAGVNAAPTAVSSFLGSDGKLMHRYSDGSIRPAEALTTPTTPTTPAVPTTPAAVPTAVSSFLGSDGKLMYKYSDGTTRPAGASTTPTTPLTAAAPAGTPTGSFLDGDNKLTTIAAPAVDPLADAKNTISSWYSTYNQPIDEAGLNYWAGQMASGRPDVFNAFRNELPSSLNIMRAHGGAVHNLAQKYKVGGAVRNFRFGGDEGEPEDAIESIVRARSADMNGEPPKYEIGPDERFQGERRGRFASVTGAETPAQQSRVSQGTEPITTSPAAQPVKLPPSATTPVSPAATDLMTMLANYSDDVYGPELKTARQKVSAENEKFAQMIETAMKGDSAVPDKTELYFRLAKAFGSPTKTGAFTENLSLVGGEAAEYAKDVRAAQRAEKQFRTQLGLEAQKLRAQGAREDLSTLRTLAGEELKDRRAILTEYLKSGRPQSEAGKAAIDAGLKQGTPEFTDFVNKFIDDKIRSGNIFKEAMVAIAGKQAETGKRRADIAEKQQKVAEEAAGKLTPKEVDLKAKAEDAVLTIDNAMRDLSRAYDLNKNSFDTTLKDTATLTILEQTGSKDPKVLNTKELMNLLKSAMISSASQKLTGVLSDSDIKLLQSVAGIDSKSKEERAQVLKNAYRALQSGRAAQEKRLQEITRGLYRETTPATGEIE